jgi:hypothetical protein
LIAGVSGALLGFGGTALVMKRETTMQDSSKQVGLIALATVLSVGPGCAMYRAQAPAGFMDHAQKVEIDHAFVGFSGTTIDGLTFDGSLGISTFSGSSDTADLSESHRIKRGEEVLWAVDCASIADPAHRPSVYLTCLYKPGGQSSAPLSLALVSSMTEPLRGVFFSSAGPFLVDATMESEAGAHAVLSIGYAISRVNSGEVIAFVDHGQPEARMSAYVSSTIAPEEREAIAPLLVTLVQTRDARFAFKDKNAGTIGIGALRVNIRDTPEDDTDATDLPPAPPLPNKPTTFEMHVNALVKMSRDAAARALARMLPERSPPVRTAADADTDAPGGPR